MPQYVITTSSRDPYTASPAVDSPHCYNWGGADQLVSPSTVALVLACRDRRESVFLPSCSSLAEYRVVELNPESASTQADGTLASFIFESSKSMLVSQNAQK